MINTVIHKFQQSEWHRLYKINCDPRFQVSLLENLFPSCFRMNILFLLYIFQSHARDPSYGNRKHGLLESKELNIQVKRQADEASHRVVQLRNIQILWLCCNRGSIGRFTYRNHNATFVIKGKGYPSTPHRSYDVSKVLSPIVHANVLNWR